MDNSTPNDTNSSNEYVEEDTDDIVHFEYIKSNLFRVIHADGVWGCVSPSLGIQIAFWNERFPIPQRVSYETLSNGEFEEIREERKVKDAIVREVEASVAIDVETAEMLAEWLQERIEEVRTLRQEQEKEESQ